MENVEADVVESSQPIRWTDNENDTASADQAYQARLSSSDDAAVSNGPSSSMIQDPTTVSPREVDPDASGSAGFDRSWNPAAVATSSFTEVPQSVTEDSSWVVEQEPRKSPVTDDVRSNDVISSCVAAGGEWQQSASTLESSQCSVTSDVSADTVQSVGYYQLSSGTVVVSSSGVRPGENHPTFVETCNHQEDFRTGLTCHDVPTALDILNTRYKLADVTIHKNMITWSSWNIADIVRGPHRESFWWKGKRKERKPTAVQTDDSSISNNDEAICKKDIEDLCGRIEQKEKEIESLLQKMTPPPQPPHPTDATDDAIMPVTAASTSAAAPPAAADSGQPTAADQQPKRGNVWQRLLRALRRRFSRQHRQQQQEEQQEQQPRTVHKRQRTL